MRHKKPKPWSQILAPGPGFVVMSPQLGPGIESKVLGAQSWAHSPIFRVLSPGSFSNY